MIRIRALRPDDAAAARELVNAFGVDTPYRQAPLAALRAALEEENDESRALVATLADEVIGLVMFGRVAGAMGAGKLHLIVVTAGARLHGVARRLADAAAAALATAGCRFLIAEVPADPLLTPARDLLDRCGFVEEARVGNFYREGVDLILMRRDLTDAR